MRILVVAGEASGDAIAGEVLGALASRGARFEAFGVVGPAARAAGADATVPTEELATMGLVEVVPNAPRVVRAVAKLRAAIRDRKPTVALLVDYHELNLVLGRFLRRAGIPVLLVVAPQTWAWRPGRARTLSRSVDHVAAILPFEVTHLESLGVPSSFVGHPAFHRPRPTRDEARESLGIQRETRVLAMLPGSRHGEVTRLAPVLSDAITRLRNEARLDGVLVARASTVNAEWLSSLASGGAHIVDGSDAAARVLAASDAAIVCSGTATVECALARVPMLVGYRLARGSALVARAALRVRSVAMPNLLLARPVVPERLQSGFTVESVVETTSQLLDPSSRLRRDQLDALPRVAERLRPPGPDGTRAADHIADILRRLDRTP